VIIKGQRYKQKVLNYVLIKVEIGDEGMMTRVRIDL